MNIEKRLQEIEARKAEIRTLLESGEEADLDAIQEELKSLADEEQELRQRLDMAQKIQVGAVNVRVVDSSATRTATPSARGADPYDTLEYRQAFMRYVTRGERSDVLEF